MDQAQSIAARILDGELPSAVLRSVHQSQPDLNTDDLGYLLEQAFRGLWLIECAWKWQLSKNSAAQDARFDLAVIARLLQGGIAVPWTREFCDSEWERIRPALAAEAEVVRRAALQSVSFEVLLDEARKLPGTPVCVQALWDGDTNGWFVRLEVITRSDSVLCETGIGRVRFGGDARLFEGKVPPWPEARHAADVGARLAKVLGAEFYFPAPEAPDDSLPGWIELRS